MGSYTYVLREVPEEARPAIATLLGRAFNLKDTTASSIAQSAPIVLLTDLDADEAAVTLVLLSSLQRAGAATLMTQGIPDDLGKIDWPRKPQLFRRDLADHIADFRFQAPGSPLTLLAMCAAGLPGAAPLAMAGAPAPAPAAPAPPAPAPVHESPRAPLTSIPLPEITPFGGMAALPPAPSAASHPPTGRVAASAPAPKGEAASRLDELFPEDESSGFVPNNQDITSILNKLLPDEEAPGGSTASSSSNRAAVPSPAAGNGALGHAVFLAKIADEGRRLKAVALISELAGISTEEAEALSKKVIIPVLKGATKEQAEAAKQQFAKIGILARVKGPE